VSISHPEWHPKSQNSVGNETFACKRVVEGGASHHAPRVEEGKTETTNGLAKGSEQRAKLFTKETSHCGAVLGKPSDKGAWMDVSMLIRSVQSTIPFPDLPSLSLSLFL